MAKPVKSIANMTKHLTKSEIAAREAAEKSLERENVNLTKPRGFTKDKKANQHWNRIVKQFEGIELLDDLDSDALARYCKILSRIDSLEAELESAEEFVYREKIMVRIESAERSQMSYASKLGLTPESRTRLAKKKAQEKPVDPEDDLYGGMEVISCASGN